MTRHTMTPAALACRADEMTSDYLACDILNNGDERELTLYFAHVDCEIDPPDDGFTTPGTCRELIGATVGDDVLTRDEARAMFGDAFVIGEDEWIDTRLDGRVIDLRLEYTGSGAWRFYGFDVDYEQTGAR